MKTNIPLILILVLFVNFAYTCYPGSRYGPYTPYGDMSHTRYKGYRDSLLPPSRPSHNLGYNGHSGYNGGYRRYGRYRRAGTVA